MQLSAALLLLPAMAFGMVMPDRVVREVGAASTPKPNPNPKVWVVDFWPGANCVKGAPSTGPAEPAKGNVGQSGCFPLSKTFKSSTIKNANGCHFQYFNDAGCTQPQSRQSTADGKCVNFDATPVVALKVTC